MYDGIKRQAEMHGYLVVKAGLPFSIWAANSAKRRKKEVLVLGMKTEHDQQGMIRADSKAQQHKSWCL
jgi:hypothetical protein